MSNKNTGGPAFPVTGYAASNGHSPPKDTWDAGFGGMTLRDYFANDADVPWNVACDSVTGSQGSALSGVQYDVGEVADRMANIKYAIADAMIAARDAE